MTNNSGVDGKTIGIVSYITLIGWIIGLVSAVNGEEKPVPFVGGYFQEWFKGL